MSVWMGMPAFPDAARKALADSQLRANLRAATGTIRAKRAAVVAERADWPELRAAGRAIKDRALRDLDNHLSLLAERVTAAGGVVHWARDAAEANRTVVGLVRAAGAAEVVKVKSMATQEIELNEALAAAGIAAYETDLAELIVQLGHDRPSHILVPAIHRNRTQIRDLFRRTMPEAPPDLTDDPEALAAAAREHLRRKFLAARVAVSGANFAVAETGALVVVESEGNGRMCLTLPEVLISVVGIEKVIPTWTDLEVMLQLLPRSSTGERMNPYTSVWRGVRPGDGPREFHLVLLDNGRTDALADEVGRDALRCIRCSACLNVCPVYERAGGHAYGSVYPGPIGAILTPQLRGVDADPVSRTLPYASTLCGACYEVCPVLIDIPRSLVHLRAKVVDVHRGTPSAERAAMTLAAKTFASPRRFALAQRLVRFGARLLRRTRLPGPHSGWTDARDIPPPPDHTFREWWATRTDTPVVDHATRERARLDSGTGAPERDGPREDHARGAGGELGAGNDVVLGPGGAEVLARVRSALGSAREDVEVPREYAHAVEDDVDVVALFAERAADYRAVVRRVAGDGGGTAAAAAVGQALRELGAASVVVPDDLPAELLSQVDGVVLRDRGDLTVDALDRVDAVLTGCAVAVAETGTIVLDAGTGQGRRALSLVPDAHVCVVRAGQVVGTVPEAVAATAGADVLTWVSGPSATSDIELHRVEGVHGPRTLVIVLVD